MSESESAAARLAAVVRDKVRARLPKNAVKRDARRDAGKAVADDSDSVRRPGVNITPASEMPRSVKFEDKALPAHMRDPADRRFVVCARANTIPQEYLERCVVWMRCNLYEQLGISKPSDDDYEAGRGINLMDLIPRVAIKPLRTFDDKQDAMDFALQARDELNADVQIFRMGEFDVSPPYTTVARVYPQNRGESRSNIATFMQQYNRQSRLNADAFRRKADQLRKETEDSVARRGTVAQEELVAEEAEQKQREEEKIPVTSMHRVDDDDTLASYRRSYIALGQRIAELEREQSQSAQSNLVSDVVNTPNTEDTSTLNNEPGEEWVAYKPVDKMVGKQPDSITRATAELDQDWSQSARSNRASEVVDAPGEETFVNDIETSREIIARCNAENTEKMMAELRASPEALAQYEARREANEARARAASENQLAVDAQEAAIAMCADVCDECGVHTPHMRQQPCALHLTTCYRHRSKTCRLCLSNE